MFEFVSGLWRDITTPTDPAAPILIWVTAAVGAAFVTIPFLWRAARHLITVLHEGGHGVVALFTGRKLTGIRLHSDTSGLTTSRGKPRGLGMILTLLAGYPAASIAGLLGAFALERDLPLVVLWGLLVVFALMLLKIRNFYGLWVLLVLGFGIFALTWWGSDPLQQVGAYSIVWFLLIGSPMPVIEMAQQRRRKARTSDADQLAGLTWFPAGVWIAVFLLITGAALISGAALLVNL